MQYNANPAGKAPSHIVYVVRARKGREPSWTPVGALWPHVDGKGFTQQIKLTRRRGQIVIRVASDDCTTN